MSRGWLAAALWVTAGTGRAAWPTQPASVVDQAVASLNAGNLDACMAWFAADASVHERGGKSYTGPDQIRTWMQAVVSHNYRSEDGPRTVAGSRVTWRARVMFDDLRALGVQSVEGDAEAVIVNGKIVSLTPAFCPGSLVLLGSASARLLEQTARAFVDAAFVQGASSAATVYCAEDFVDHAPLPGGFASRDGYQAGIAALWAAFPDLRASVEDVIAAGDRVVVRCSLTGTQRGPYLGAPATFRQATFAMVDVFRVQDGRLAERWGQLDTGAISRQLGLSDAAPGAPAPASKKTRKGMGGILGWLL